VQFLYVEKCTSSVSWAQWIFYEYGKFLESSPTRLAQDWSHITSYSIALENSHISAPKQKFKNLVGNFFNVKLKNLYAIFQPSSFKTEGGVWVDRHTHEQHFFSSDPLLGLNHSDFSNPLANFARSWRYLTFFNIEVATCHFLCKLCCF